jgi:hypothetical protein
MLFPTWFYSLSLLFCPHGCLEYKQGRAGSCRKGHCKGREVTNLAVGFGRNVLDLIAYLNMILVKKKIKK